MGRDSEGNAALRAALGATTLASGLSDSVKEAIAAFRESALRVAEFTATFRSDLNPVGSSIVDQARLLGPALGATAASGGLADPLAGMRSAASALKMMEDIGGFRSDITGIVDTFGDQRELLDHAFSTTLLTGDFPDRVAEANAILRDGVQRVAEMTAAFRSDMSATAGSIADQARLLDRTLGAAVANGGLADPLAGIGPQFREASGLKMMEGIGAFRSDLTAIVYTLADRRGLLDRALGATQLTSGLPTVSIADQTHSSDRSFGMHVASVLADRSDPLSPHAVNLALNLEESVDRLEQSFRRANRLAGLVGQLPHPFSRHESSDSPPGAEMSKGSAAELPYPDYDRLIRDVAEFLLKEFASEADGQPEHTRRRPSRPSWFRAVIKGGRHGNRLAAGIGILRLLRR